MTVTRKCENDVTMRDEIVQCGCPMLPLNRQVSNDQSRLYLFDHRYEQ